MPMGLLKVVMKRNGKLTGEKFTQVTKPECPSSVYKCCGCGASLGYDKTEMFIHVQVL